MKKFGIKEVVATGIGTALFIVLTEVQIPLGIIPNTSMQPRAAVLAFLAAVFGPVVGGIIGLLGHALGDALFYGGRILGRFASPDFKKVQKQKASRQKRVGFCRDAGDYYNR